MKSTTTPAPRHLLFVKYKVGRGSNEVIAKVKAQNAQTIDDAIAVAFQKLNNNFPESYQLDILSIKDVTDPSQLDDRTLIEICSCQVNRGIIPLTHEDELRSRGFVPFASTWTIGRPQVGDWVLCKPIHYRAERNVKNWRRITDIVLNPLPNQFSGVAVNAHGYDDFWLKTSEIFDYKKNHAK